jgi:hypothetical protein
VTRNTIASPTKTSPSPSRGITYSHIRGNDTKSQQYNCYDRNGENTIHKYASPATKGSNPTTGLVTQSEDILITAKSHNTKSEISLNHTQKWKGYYNSNTQPGMSEGYKKKKRTQTKP